MIFAATLVGMMAYAAGDKNVTGEATYYDDGSKSKRECEKLAEQQARVDALAKAFGTIVTQDILQSDRVVGNREHNDFLNLSQTEVRGEWISDTSAPEFKYDHDQNENLIVHCKVRGVAREISNQAADCEALVLRNAPDKAFANNMFDDGDTVFLYFKPSANGFLNVYLEDERGDVNLLLPYPLDTKERVAVNKDKEYIFFSYKNKDGQFGAPIQEYTLQAPDRPEYNRLYVVYSTEYFSRPVMTNDTGIPQIKSADFNKWLLKARRNDPKMNVKTFNIQITPRS